MLTPREKKWLELYMKRVASIWDMWQQDRKSGTYGGMSMKERDDLLKAMRDKLYRLQQKDTKTR